MSSSIRNTSDIVHETCARITLWGRLSGLTVHTVSPGQKVDCPCRCLRRKKFQGEELSRRLDSWFDFIPQTLISRQTFSIRLWLGFLIYAWLCWYKKNYCHLKFPFQTNSLISVQTLAISYFTQHKYDIKIQKYSRPKKRAF